MVRNLGKVRTPTPPFVFSFEGLLAPKKMFRDFLELLVNVGVFSYLRSATSHELSNFLQ